MAQWEFGRGARGYANIAFIAVLALSLAFLVLVVTPVGEASAPGYKFSPVQNPGRFNNLNGGSTFEEFFPEIHRQDIASTQCTPRLNPYCSPRYTLDQMNRLVGMGNLNIAISNCNSLGVEPFKSHVYLNEKRIALNERGEPVQDPGTRRAVQWDSGSVLFADDGMFIYCTAALQFAQPVQVNYNEATRTATVSWETNVNSNSSIRLALPDEKPDLTVVNTATQSKSHEVTLRHPFEDGTLYQVVVESCSVIPTVQCVKQLTNFQTSGAPLGIDVTSPAPGAVISYNLQPVIVRAMVQSSETAVMTHVYLNGEEVRSQMCTAGAMCNLELPTLTPEAYAVRVVAESSGRTVEDSTTFTISKANPTLAFTLNGATGDLTVNPGQTVTATVSFAESRARLSLAIDGSTVARAANSVTHTVSFDTAGTHSFEATYPGDAIYNPTSVTRVVTVNEVDAPPTVTFTSPTPGEGERIGLDSATIRIETSERVTATLLHSTPEMARPEELPMGRISDTRYTQLLSSLRGGEHTVVIRVTDGTGNTVTSEPRTFYSPIAIQVQEFENLGANAIVTFRVAGEEKLFIATSSEDGRSQGYVHIVNPTGEASTVLSSLAISPTVTGFYSLAVANEAGVPTLYAGSGGTGLWDGQVWKTTNGVEWTRADTFFRFEKKVNQLKVIDGILYSASTTQEDAREVGSLCWNFNQRPMLCQDYNFNGPVMSVEKYNGRLYASNDNSQIFELQPDGLFQQAAYVGARTIIFQLQSYNGRLYFAGGGVTGALYSSTDARTWTNEATPGAWAIKQMNVLSDGNLYLSGISRDNTSLLKKGVGDVSLITTFAPLDQTRGITELGGRKFVIASETNDAPHFKLYRLTV